MKSLKSILAVVVATVGLVSCTSVQSQEEEAVREAYTIEGRGKGIAHLESIDFETFTWAYPSTKDSVFDVCVMLQYYFEKVLNEVDKQYPQLAPVIPIQDSYNNVGGFWDNQKGLMPSQSFILNYYFAVQDKDGIIYLIIAEYSNYNYNAEISIYATVK